MITILTVNFLSAFAIAARISSMNFAINEENGECRANFAKFGTGVALSFALSAALARHHLAISLIFAHLSPIFSISRQKFRQWRLWCQFSRERIEFLDEVILGMRTGLGFRTSVRRILAKRPGLGGYLSPISSQINLCWSGSPGPQISAPPEVCEFVREILAIDQQAHEALGRVIAWRRRLRTEFEFRRRSGQILAQIHAQGLVVGGLYLALLGFVLWRSGLTRNWPIIAVSLALFAAGMIGIFSFGRRVKWNF